MLKAVLYFAALASLYGVGYYLNHRTPKPEGCENLSSECEGCGVTSCAKHPSHDQVEEKGDEE